MEDPINPYASPLSDCNLKPNLSDDTKRETCIGVTFKGIYTPQHLTHDSYKKWIDYYKGESPVRLFTKLIQLMSDIRGICFLDSCHESYVSFYPRNIDFVQVGIDRDRIGIFSRMFGSSNSTDPNLLNDIRERINREQGLAYLIDFGENHLVYQGVLGLVNLTIPGSDPETTCAYDRVVISDIPLIKRLSDCTKMKKIKLNITKKTKE